MEEGRSHSLQDGRESGDEFLDMYSISVVLSDNFFFPFGTLTEETSDCGHL